MVIFYHLHTFSLHCTTALWSSSFPRQCFLTDPFRIQVLGANLSYIVKNWEAIDRDNHYVWSTMVENNYFRFMRESKWARLVVTRLLLLCIRGHLNKVESFLTYPHCVARGHLHLWVVVGGMLFKVANLDVVPWKDMKVERHSEPALKCPSIINVKCHKYVCVQSVKPSL